MEKKLEKFIFQISDFEKKTQKEQTLYFGYFITKVSGKQIFTPKQIIACYNSLDLKPPRNIHHQFSRLKKNKPPKILEKNKGYSLERTTASMIKNSLQNSVKTKTTSKKEFPLKELRKKLGKKFNTEFDDLSLVFGKSGTCTAFLLRKILEKEIYLVFAKNRLGKKLETSDSRLVGLKKMLELAQTEKIKGKHILMPKTADKIEGIKFLGDSAAHNPLTNPKMETIIPQLPFIVTAFEELAINL